MSSAGTNRLRCCDVRMALPAYEMGALDADEHHAVAAHLTACAACRAERVGLDELLSLLDHVTPAEAAVGHLRSRSPGTHAAEVAAPTVSLVALGQGPATRRGHLRRGTRRALVAAACAAALAGGLAGGYAAWHRPAGVVAAPSPSPTVFPRVFPTVAGQVRTVSAADAATGTAATVRALPQAWGTWVQLTLTRRQVPSPERCRLVVVGKDGQTQVAATWKADHGGTFTVPGGMAMSPDQVAHYDVDTLDGRQLISVPA